jgi:hypothetical protein
VVKRLGQQIRSTIAEDPPIPRQLFWPHCSRRPS